MAKKTTKKEIKKVKEKTTQKIKEKTSNKADNMVKNPQIIDLEMAEKTPQKIELKMGKKEVKKPVEIEEEVIENPTTEIKEEELVKVLKIPMHEAQSDTPSSSVKEALFSSPETPEPEFKEEEEEEEENLNDKYFDSDSSDEDLDSVFFEDEELMSEMAVEIIDLGMTTMAQAIAKDFNNPQKFEVSEYKKKKIKKPLRILLKKRGVKVSPEVMFTITLLVIYVPLMVTAVKERNAKANIQKNPPTDIAEDIPENVKSVDAEKIHKQHQSTIHPISQVNKKGGRPKGSKDKKPRKTDGYKGNSNSK